MRLLNKLSEYQRTQNELIKNNVTEIDNSNLNMLRLTLIIACIFFSAYLIISFMSESYEDLTTPYFIVLLAMLSLLLSYKKLHKITSAANLLYITYTIACLFSLYVSAVLAPNYPSITILLFLFLIPIVILDKGWKICLFELLFAAVNFLMIIPLKESSLVLDEYLNSVLFLSLAITFGEHLRISKFENFELKRQAVIREKIDTLTNLENRRGLYLHLAVCEEQQAMEKSIGVFMIDIDRFKPYNDTYGHQKGDMCLKTIGRCFLEFGKEHNISFYRYGGEEFVGIAVNYSSEELYQTGRKLNQHIRNLQIPHQLSETGFITISIGIAICEHGNRNELNSLISRADTALYAAKAGGRNRVIAYNQSMNESSLTECISSSFKEFV